MNRKHNFSAGPATLPLPVLEEAQRRLVDHGEGLSVMEMSHRSDSFQAILDEAKGNVARLLSLPDEYDVLFLQGGASLQFGMVPMNLGSGAYVTTGVWSEKALSEAKTVGEAEEIWTSKADGFRTVPKEGEALAPKGGARYLHITTNNTIYGTQWHHLPETSLPLVADMSSDILSRPLDVSRFGLIYAGAQKNVGPSGVTLVIGRKDVLADFQGAASVPKILRYKTHLDAGSLYNTPPTFGVWLCALATSWIEEQGGLEEMDRRAKAKAGRLYDVIDRRSDVFEGHASKDARSLMNVTFRLPSDEAQDRFLAAAREAGCIGLKGHRSTGGIRASIYNALPMESVEVLAELMERFQP